MQSFEEPGRTNLEHRLNSPYMQCIASSDLEQFLDILDLLVDDGNDLSCREAFEILRIFVVQILVTASAKAIQNVIQQVHSNEIESYTAAAVAEEVEVVDEVVEGALVAVEVADDSPTYEFSTLSSIQSSAVAMSAAIIAPPTRASAYAQLTC